MDLSFIELAILFSASIVAAIINSVAGGGSFLVFPLLLFAGIPPTIASITNKFSMLAGTTASIFGYWQEVISHPRQVCYYAAIALLGSLIGSLILLQTSNEQFGAMVPWLIVSATLLFAFGRSLVVIAKRFLHHTSHSPSMLGRIMGFVGQLAIGIYGGFFGAGKGIMLVALYELIGIKNIHVINGIKVSVSVAINIISALTFLIAGVIYWPAAIAMMLGAIIGGYFGAHYAKKLPQLWIRYFIITYGLSVSVYFFIT